MIRGRNFEVPLAAGMLVAAVIGALLAARAGLGGSGSGEPPGITGGVSSADAWALPSDSLLGFVRIPAGAFLMGSDASVDPLAYENERWSPDQAQGSVDLPEFFIGRHEVTAAQYEAFARSTGRPSQRPAPRPPDHPATEVSWPDALAYGRWLQARLLEWSGTPPPLRLRLEEGWIVTLPTEAQWEKAARGADGRVYPWGDQPRADRANLRSRGARPVGSFPCPECPYDLRDLIGNVWEWTRSPLQPYPYDPANDRNTLQADALWVIRGGAFSDTEQNARAATRGGADPGARRPFMGFRLVLTPE